MNAPRLVIGMVLVLAAFALVGAGLVHQIAPMPGSTPVYQYSPGMPSNSAQPFTVPRSNAFTPSSSGLTYSGISLLVYTTVRDTTVFWTMSYTIACGGTTMSTGSANVFAYLGNPSATAWATIPAQSGSTIGTSTCSLTVSRTGGQGGDGLYWVSEAANPNVHGLWVWGQPPGAPTPGPSSGPPPTAPTDTSTNPPSPPTGPKVDVMGAVATAAFALLLVFGVIFILMGIFD